MFETDGSRIEDRLSTVSSSGAGFFYWSFKSLLGLSVLGGKFMMVIRGDQTVCCCRGFLFCSWSFTDCSEG